MLVVNASQMIILPSCDELTMCRLSADQSVHSTLPWWPFKIRRCLMLTVAGESRRCATEQTDETQRQPDIIRYSKEGDKTKQVSIRLAKGCER